MGGKLWTPALVLNPVRLQLLDAKFHSVHLHQLLLHTPSERHDNLSCFYGGCFRHLRRPFKPFSNAMVLYAWD
ncbi:hypothetical protein MUCCIDRAFT_154855, partial [Mucor lusitanicus CBS 277.49]